VETSDVKRISSIFITIILALLVLASPLSAQKLVSDFEIATERTNYVCRFNEIDEIELFTRPAEREGLWNPTDFNLELNTIRTKKRRWRKIFIARRSGARTKSIRIQRAKKRWRYFRRMERQLRACGQSLAIEGEIDPCVEMVAPMAVDESSFAHLRIIQGKSCSPQNSPVVKLEIVHPYATGTCSGTMLDEYTVLTAAHCVDSNPHRITVHSGRQSVAAYSYTPHPSYSANTLKGIEAYDVAVIKTSMPLKGPYASLVYGAVATGEQAIISGYGQDSDGNAGALRAVALELSYVDTDTIATRYHRTRNNGNTCFGDSGGPLFVSRQGEWVIAGVISNGDKQDCGPGDISRYANLTQQSLRSFILDFAEE
jgi:hypothetical protein